ncbi:hypothetical protein AB4Z30_18445 [Paenibacillus sp. 2TAF8]|jgi:hypothetical protein
MFENREQLQEILKKANQHARKQAKESGASMSRVVIGLLKKISVIDMVSH